MAYGQSRGDSDAQAWQPERMDTVPGLDLDSPPFDLLDAHSREHLQSAVDMGFYPAGTRLIEAGKPSEHVFVLCKGHVHALDPVAGGARRFADYAADDVFGSCAVIAGRSEERSVGKAGGSTCGSRWSPNN